MKLLSNPARLALPLSLCLFALGCPSDSDSGGNGGNGNQDEDGPTLESGDRPDESPCPDQDILTDAALLAAFKTALAEGSFLYLDVPFDGSDSSIYLRKCGHEDLWDPSDNTDEIAPSSEDFELSDLFASGNAGICTDDYASTFQYGLPRSGTYRKEFKVSHDGTTYHARVRVEVSGDAAGSTFSSLGVSIPDDIENTLGYTVDGVAVTHDEFLGAIGSALEAPDADVNVQVLDMPGGNVWLSATVQFLCVTTL